MKKSSLAALVAAVSLVAMSAPAQGAAAPPTGVPRDTVNQVGMANSGVDALAEYVRVTQAGYVLRAPASVLATVDPARLAGLRVYWSQIGRLVDSGQLVQVGNSYVSPGMTGYSTWRGSHGYIKTHWYGLEAGIDSYLRGKITGGLEIAAAAALMGGGPYGEPIAIALALESGILSLCAHTNGWSYVYWVGTVPPYGGMVCNPFGLK
jgi:hypothetical protein